MTRRTDRALPIEHTIPYHMEMDGALQIYDHDDMGQGWLTMAVQCPRCRQQWRAVAAVGAMGIVCPYCGETGPFMIWTIPDGAEDQRHAWLQFAQ